MLDQETQFDLICAKAEWSSNSQMCFEEEIFFDSSTVFFLTEKCPSLKRALIFHGERSPKNSVSSERKTSGGHWQGEIFAAVSRAKGAIYANYLFSHKPWNTEKKRPKTVTKTRLELSKKKVKLLIVPLCSHQLFNSTTVWSVGPVIYRVGLQSYSSFYTHIQNPDFSPFLY